MPQAPVLVSELVSENAQALRLRVQAGHQGLNREIMDKDINRPGLLLAGFKEQFPHNRVQLIGDSETLYLDSLTAEERSTSIKRLLDLDIPCVVVTGKNQLLPEMIGLANERNVPLITSNRSTSDVAFLFTNYLGLRFAPRDSIHGTLVDVYGTGLLLIGRAGIGKSEIALDLVERGHRLVADDIVDLTVKPPDILIGSGPELLKHFIEIRGVGVINVREIFGVRAIRLQKRIETVVELKDWEETQDYERLGLTEHFTQYLGIKIPLISLPIYPGKNITVIAEAIALNLHLKIYGYHAAQDLNRKLLKSLKTRREINEYLKWDNE